jgi:hypothetical protein
MFLKLSLFNSVGLMGHGNVPMSPLNIENMLYKLIMEAKVPEDILRQVPKFRRSACTR